MPFTSAYQSPTEPPRSAPAGPTSRQPAGNSLQAIYDKLSGPSAEYCHFMQYGGAYIPHVATREDVMKAMDWLRNAIIERKAEIDAGVKSGRNVQIIDQMRAEFRAMSERYDEAADALAALDAPPMAAE